jgi:putative ABC transport system permease protein
MLRLFRRSRHYEDLAVSIEEHIEERTDELVEEGLSREAAAQRARREFGRVTQVTERSREAWQWQRVEQLLHDWRLTFRRLAKAPGFTTTVLLTLAIGIGANTAVFSVINSVVLRPLPYPGSDRLVALHLDAPGAAGLTSFSSGLRLSASMFLSFSTHNRTLAAMGVWSPQTANVTGLAQPEEVHSMAISDGVLETLDVPAVAGRWFDMSDQDPRGAKSVMLSYGYWQRRFGGDRTVIGRILDVDSEPRTIVGVMPRGFRIVDHDFDLLVPLAFDRTHQILAGFAYNGIGRMKPGVSIASANADFRQLLPVWMDSWSNGPGSDPHWYENWKITPNFQPLKQSVIGNIAGILWVVMATIGLVLLIACTNLANLLLVRAESRQLELSIRAALGAGRFRIVRELLLESVTLGLIGGLLAVAVSYAGLRFLVALGPANLPRLAEISLDARSIAFTFALALFSGLVLGLIPAAKHAWRRHELAGTGGRTASASRERHRSRNVLIVAQVAMSLVLLVSATLMIRTFVRMRRVDPGFADAAHILTLRTAIPDSLVRDPTTVMRIENAILDKLAALPGVHGVGLARSAPMEGIEPAWDNIFVKNRTYPNFAAPLRFFNYVSPGYFRTMGTRLLAGRDFSWDDLYGTHPVAIVSANMAREEWGSPAAAVGNWISQNPKEGWQQVIGVVQDVYDKGIDQAPTATVYWGAMLRDPYSPPPGIDVHRSVTVVVHSADAGTDAFLHEVEQAVWSVNANLPVASPRTMSEIADASMARTSFTLVMLAIAGSMALLLGIVGIYGVIAYSVAQRRREIGIRLALGAQRRELRWMFVRSALALTGVGILLGLVAAAGLTQLMKSLLFGISPTDPLTYGAVIAVLGAVALVASYLPARRAASVNPVEALRAE